MKPKKGYRRLLSLLLVLCMVLTMGTAVFATSTSGPQGNTDVDGDKQGVLQVLCGVKVKETGQIDFLMGGTGFLVNDTYLVTCNHVIDFDSQIEDGYSVYDYIKDKYGYERKKADDQRVVQISVYRDVNRDVKVISESEETDLAIVKMDEPLGNRKPLKICLTPPATTAPCYTIGFPGLMTSVTDVRTFTSDDATITGGLVNKLFQLNSVDCIAYSASTTGGGSGGPLVNYSGEVIGITSASISENYGGNDFMIAVDVKELVEILEPLRIEYTPADGTTGGGDTIEVPEQGQPAAQETPSVPETPPIDKSILDEEIRTKVDTEGHDKDLVTKYEDALADAEKVQANAEATQGEVDKAVSDLKKAREAVENEEIKPAVSLPLIIGIAAAIIILIVILILALGSKNKKKDRYDDIPEIPPYTPPVPPVSPVGGGYGADPYAGKPAGGTTVLGGGATDTTVLGGDANATTVLGGGISYGTLTRVKTGEAITINKDQFRIGRERSRVDYCISDNTAVGRLHAIIVSRGGSTYVVDQNSTNCTFVNSVRATANQEVRLNNGDKIKFADEDFVYNAF